MATFLLVFISFEKESMCKFLMVSISDYIFRCESYLGFHYIDKDLCCPNSIDRH